MKPQISKEDFFLILKEKLETKTPFAMCRFSDGEVMLLNRKQYYNEYVRIITQLWGYTPSEQELVEVAAYLVEALDKVDIIGFPTARHLARQDFFKDAIWVIKQHVREDILDKPTVSSDVFYDYLGEALLSNSQALYPDYFDELLRDRETVNIITCRDLADRLKDKYNIKNVNQFLLAPEAKFVSGYEGERHYPYQFNKVKEWVKTIDCKGNLCMVGGGVFSKIYNVWFKEQGGISVCIGAVADLWAGKSTRGKTRGLDAIDETFKI